MKKKYHDITIEEAESFIQCRDENGENLCTKGCKFRFQMPWGGCCAKNWFLSMLYDLCKEKGLISENEDGELEIEIEGSKQ